MMDWGGGRYYYQMEKSNRGSTTRMDHMFVSSSKVCLFSKSVHSFAIFLYVHSCLRLTVVFFFFIMFLSSLNSLK